MMPWSMSLEWVFLKLVPGQEMQDVNYLSMIQLI